MRTSTTERVYKRGPRWYFDISDGRGRRYRLAAIDNSEAGAGKEWRSFHDAILEGRDPMGKRRAHLSASMTVAEALDEYLQHLTDQGKRTPKTTLPAKINVLKEGLGRYRLTSLTPKTLDTYKATRKKSARTIANDLTVLRAALNWQKEIGNLSVHVFDKIGADTKKALFPKYENSGREIGQAELEKILAKLEKRYHPAVHLAIGTGMRLAEIGDLQWSEIDFKNNQIVLPGSRTKNGKKREVPLTPELKALLPEPRGIAGPVWKSHAGTKRFSDSVGRAWYRAVKLSGVKHARFHDLRHSFATRFLAAGGSPADPMKIAVWGAAFMLNHYGHGNADSRAQPSRSWHTSGHNSSDTLTEQA